MECNPGDICGQFCSWILYPFPGIGSTTNRTRIILTMRELTTLKNQDNHHCSIISKHSTHSKPHYPTNTPPPFPWTFMSPIGSEQKLHNRRVENCPLLGIDFRAISLEELTAITTILVKYGVSKFYLPICKVLE